MDKKKYYVISPTQCECGRCWSLEFLENISDEIERYENFNYTKSAVCLNCNKRYDVTWTTRNGSFYIVGLEPTNNVVIDIAKMASAMNVFLKFDERLNVIEKKLKIK